MIHPGPEAVDLLVIGGGAAGYFAAIHYAERCPDHRVLILEKSREVLGKVRISGGGRCNVTHACFEPSELVRHYPRGARALQGPFHRWGPAETMQWFESRGVPLKVEDDGRVFPCSDRSASIIDCLTTQARQAGVAIQCRTAVVGATAAADGRLEVETSDGARRSARRVLLSPGGIRNPTAAHLASALGHTIIPAAPSLFTFKIDDPRLTDLQGLSVAEARVDIPGTRLAATGPVLITHWGLSGPGILRISAWGARELQHLDYHFEIRINWTGAQRADEVIAEFQRRRHHAPKKQIGNHPCFGIPARLWRRLLGAIAPEVTTLPWSQLPKATARLLAEGLTACAFSVTGKSTNKDEFVTAGGVPLKEVDLRTLASRRTPGLHFAGEILDIDGITGGFNFQAAWTTGHLAGCAMAEAALDSVAT